MMTRIAMTLVAGFALALPGMCADDTKDASKKLQGTWQLTKGVRGGEAMPAEKVEKTKLEFKDDKVIVHDDGNEKPATYTLDPSKKPGEIDIKPGNEDKTVKGIYKLDGDTLTICFGRDGADRPTEFESKAGSNNMLVVLKREKK